MGAKKLRTQSLHVSPCAGPLREPVVVQVILEVAGREGTEREEKETVGKEQN